MDAAKVVDLFYDLQFDRALAEMRELETRDPASPVAPFYAGVAFYQRYLLEDPPRAETFKAV